MKGAISVNDFKLPDKLYMPRKTFEFGAHTHNHPLIKSLAKNFLSKIDLGYLSNRNKALEKFWAHEHACYIALCKRCGKRYSEYLPGREYTYLLLRDLISTISSRKQINVLDGGCGSGIACALLALTGATAIGVDIARSALRFAAAISEEYETCVNLALSNLTNLPFPDNRFDVVFSLGVFEHYPPEIQKRFFEEFVRVSKQWILIVTPNKNSPIYKTMAENEFRLMPPELIYPEEHYLFPVDWFRLSHQSGISRVESSAIHIVPPKTIPRKYLTSESYHFFKNITKQALATWDGQIITTWLSVEERCPKEERTRYGWFSYTLYEESV